MSVIGVVLLLVWVAALVDVIIAPSESVQRLPKVAWVLIVALLSTIGALLWFGLGRDWTATRRPPKLPVYLREDRSATPSGAGPRVDTRSTEEQLAELDREIEFYRRKAELEARRIDGSGTPGDSTAGGGPHQTPGTDR